MEIDNISPICVEALACEAPRLGQTRVLSQGWEQCMEQPNNPSSHPSGIKIKAGSTRTGDNSVSFILTTQS